MGLFFFSSRRRHTIYWRDWSSDVCSSDLDHPVGADAVTAVALQAAQRLVAVGARDPRVLGEALVGAAPAVVADDGQRRREGPVLAGRAHLLGGRGLHVADEAGSCAAPSPMLCGNSVAPKTFELPWTASMPQIAGTPAGLPCLEAAQ